MELKLFTSTYIISVLLDAATSDGASGPQQGPKGPSRPLEFLVKINLTRCLAHSVSEFSHLSLLYQWTDPPPGRRVPGCITLVHDDQIALLVPPRGVGGTCLVHHVPDHVLGLAPAR